MKRLLVLFYTINFFLFSLLCHTLVAQTAQKRIAVFAPIYIDSAFNGTTFKLWGNYLPKNMLPGLDFYNGAMAAIDSLKFDSTGNLLVDFYDYKSRGNSLKEIIAAEDSNNLNNCNLMIASFNNRADVKTLADYANAHKIPLISATYPNDGGVSNNPYFFLLNPTLRTHIKAIYNRVQSNAVNSNLVYISHSSTFETMVDTYFKQSDSSHNTTYFSSPISLTDTFTTKQLYAKLDSTKDNVIVCTSINDKFVEHLVETAAQIKKYKLSIIGMPTWEGIKHLDKEANQTIDVFYTAAYNYSKNNLCNRLAARYTQKFNAKPNDYFYRGYEVMLKMAKLLSLYNNLGLELMNDDMFKVINIMDVKPVTNHTAIDYYENNKIYFIKKVEKLDKPKKSTKT